MPDGGRDRVNRRRATGGQLANTSLMSALASFWRLHTLENTYHDCTKGGCLWPPIQKGRLSAARICDLFLWICLTGACKRVETRMFQHVQSSGSTVLGKCGQFIKMFGVGFGGERQSRIPEDVCREATQSARNLFFVFEFRRARFVARKMWSE